MKKKLIILLLLIVFAFLGLDNVSFAEFNIEALLNELQNTWDVDTKWISEKILNTNNSNHSNLEKDSDNEWDLIIEWTYNLGIDNLSNPKRNIIVKKWWVLTILNSLHIDWNITVYNWTLIIDENTSISGNILLNWANYTEIWKWVNLENLSGSTEVLIIEDLSTITNLHLVVYRDSLLQNNIKIKNIHLKTKTLNIGANSNVWTWVIYTYQDFNGNLEKTFSWKLIMFHNFNINHISNFDGNICILNNTRIWTNNIYPYNYRWLYGNIYPLLSFDINKKSEKYMISISKIFDKNIWIFMKKINYYNWKLKKTKDKKEIKSIKDKKNRIKMITYNIIDKEFNLIQKYIDDNKASQNLFQKVKTNYKLAIKWESMGQISQICNNNNIVNFSVSSIHIENNKIIFKDLNIKMKRYRVLSKEDVKTVLKLAWKLSLERLYKVNKKIEIILPILAKKRKIKAVNIVLDIRKILENLILYYNS